MVVTMCKTWFNGNKLGILQVLCCVFVWSFL